MTQRAVQSRIKMEQQKKSSSLPAATGVGCTKTCFGWRLLVRVLDMAKLDEFLAAHHNPESTFR